MARDTREDGAPSTLSTDAAGEERRQALRIRLATAAADLAAWINQRQPLLLLLQLVAEDATTEAEMRGVAHQAHALVEQARAMVQQLHALEAQLEPVPEEPRHEQAA
jgi:hypothetical protein